MIKSVVGLITCVAALMAPAAIGDPCEWSVTGSGVGGGVVAGDHVELGAHSDIGGANARGHAESQGAILNGTTPVSLNYGGDVICVNVSGNKALVVYKLREPLTFPELPGRVFPYGSTYVEDNGEPVDGQPVDRMTDFLNQTTFFCSLDASTFFAASLAAPLESGNYVVRDGS